MSRGKGVMRILLLVWLTSFCYDARTEEVRGGSEEICILDSSLPFSWMIRIWDTLFRVQLSQGALIRPDLVLSTCLPVLRDYPGTSKSLLIGQRIVQNGNNCTQTRGVMEKFQHPNCTYVDQLLYDFMVWRAEKPFVVTGAPFLKFPALSKLNGLISQLEYNPNNTKCQLAYYGNPFDSTTPIIKYQSKSLVVISPFKSKCVDLLCERCPEDDGETQKCVSRHTGLPDHSVVCAYDSRRVLGGLRVCTTTQLEFGVGAVLFCDGLAIGLFTRQVVRSLLPHHRNFRLFTTFLPSLTWIEKQMELIDLISKMSSHNNSLPIKPLVESKDVFYEFKYHPGHHVTWLPTPAPTPSLAATQNLGQLCIVVTFLSLSYPRFP